ncbi:helix-turn-helix transcriptional regulator [Gordonia sp. TBRC 11910]|uniref:Helix-turn-helix transcriptional regulator n=1 Tax=Gordonia asplenii TaxID=2725283 RepID=A0A848L0W5_9ACTN|nr:helix-turn-helix transcriptional regulator [Gordonia asplenii]NMO04097.1 helix-turn-helix transcriptional regulator [Gordonia asplenii]
MTTVHPDVGSLVREWRTRRRLSQLELGLRADVSAKHVSFVETGRSRPTREMLLNLSEHLDIPLRERNEILLAGGFAPAYPEHSISDVPMAAVASAISQILGAHQPNPAVVVDRQWSMVDANPAVGLLIEGCSAELLEPPVNVLRLALHPAGMARRIVNLGQWRAHLLDRLQHQIAVTGDPKLVRLAEELAGYPGADHARAHTSELIVPLQIDTAAGRLNFLSTTTVFGAPLDVTVADLAIEAFYPADEATRATLATVGA